MFWDRVTSIEELNEDDPYSYDLSVEDTQKFICGGVVVHNTEKNTRRLFEYIDASAPVVVFMDEV